MTLLPVRHTFTIVKGATFQTRIEIYANSTGTVLKDLTNYTSELVIHDNMGNILLSLTDGNGITLGGVEGTLDIRIDTDVTETLEWRSGLYWLSITDPTDVTSVLLRGSFKTVNI